MMFPRVLCVLWAGLLMAQTAADPSATAKKALDSLLGQKYADLTQLLSPQARTVFPETVLAKMGAEIKSYGAVEKTGVPSIRRVETASVVTIPVTFATQNINFQFAVNKDGLITGISMSPGPAEWRRPAYSKPETFREVDVTIGADQWKLPGTLTVPSGNGPFPAVVLVHGTGPLDRDETIGGVRVFKDLAEGLASRGIVVLRYEKRTRQFPGVPRMPKYTVEQETVQDAARAAALLRTRSEVNPQRVFVAGHGLGGYLAPRIAAEDGKLAGIVLLAANERPLEDILLDQAIYMGLTGMRLDSVKAGAARVKALDPSDADGPPVLGLPATYMIDLKDYDPAAEAKKAAVPVLVLQGERDFEVTMKDFGLWKSGLAGQKDVTLRSYPALNHLLVAGEGKSTEAEYRRAGNVAPEVINDIAAFVAR